MKREYQFLGRKQLWLSLFVFVLLLGNDLFAQMKLTEESWVLPTYPVNAADKNPMFFKGESYQGASKMIYPYALNDMISNEKGNPHTII